MQGSGKFSCVEDRKNHAPFAHSFETIFVFSRFHLVFEDQTKVGSSQTPYYGFFDVMIILHQQKKRKKCFHHPAIYSNIPTLMEIFILIIIINIIMITIIYFYFCLFFHLTYSRRASTLPSGLLWSLRIPPSLPGSRLTIF